MRHLSKWKVVDLFCGGGGFSTAVSMVGSEVVAAVDYDPKVLDVHIANHPNTRHIQADLSAFNFRTLPKYDVLVASPPCTGFSKARGKERPEHQQMRNLMWTVPNALKANPVRVALIENVPEVFDWSQFDLWMGTLNEMGYDYQALTSDAADWGVPQNRVRTFIALVNKRPDLKTDGYVGREVTSLVHPVWQNHKPISGCLEWDQGNWSDLYKEGRAQATIDRFERAIEDGLGSRFIMPYYGSGSGTTGRSIQRPIGTLTTRERWALVDLTKGQRGKMRMLSPSEARKAMGFPDGYVLDVSAKRAHKVLGNAVCPPVAKSLLEQLIFEWMPF